jgi:hypothetical protein
MHRIGVLADKEAHLLQIDDLSADLVSSADANPLKQFSSRTRELRRQRPV